MKLEKGLYEFRKKGLIIRVEKTYNGPWHMYVLTDNGNLTIGNPTTLKMAKIAINNFGGKWWIKKKFKPKRKKKT